MGLGLANALAGLEEGIRNFDAALAGLGGCPFAPGASGNIVTEDLVFMLESMGFETGIDLEKLVAARAVLTEGLPAEPQHGGVARLRPAVGGGRLHLQVDAVRRAVELHQDRQGQGRLAELKGAAQG